MKITVWFRFACICFVFCLHSVHVSAQSANSYHAIDSTEWQKAVKGLNYNEEPEKQQTTDVTMEAPEAVGGGVSMLVQILLYAAIIALLVYIILRITGRDIFSKNQQIRKKEIVSEEDLEQAPMESDLQKFLRSALEKKDFRLAIRIYYLMILQELHEREIIVWKKNKTNRDYILESSGRDYSHQFMHNTMIYEYIWYGEKQIAETQFAQVKPSFLNLLQDIASRRS